MPGEPTARDGADTITTAAELGRALKYLVRRRPGGPVKVAALARRLNLSQSTLYAYLAGTTVPPSDVLDDLLGELGAPASEHRRLSLARDALHRRRAASQPRQVPHELPADTAGFTGRAAELDELDAVLSGDAGSGAPARIASVSGPAGVGKTALAVRWCHRVTHEFPDGCLYSDLHGYSPADPRDPADVLAGFLRGLGVDGGEIPDDPHERAARLRSLLTGRRVLILLDNALDADQTRLLLPGSPTCFVVITSRADLAGLQIDPGAHHIGLRPLPVVEGMALLRAHLGSKVDDAEDAARRLVDRCDGLPLALRVVAAQAIHHARPLDDLVAELSGQGLDLLDVGDRTTAIGTVFSWSLRHLPAATATDFALLGSHPVRELDTAGIAALLDTDTRAASRRVDRLVRAHLVQRSGAGRFGMHDLVRQYAGDRASELPAEIREAAVGRLVDHVIERATWAMDVLHPDEPNSGPVAEPAAEQLGAARAWLDAEWHNLLAVVADSARRGWPEPTARLTTVLRRHLDEGGRHSDALTVLGHALEASRQAGDLAAEAEALHSLGVAYLRLGRHEDAGKAHRAAIAVCRECGDRHGEAAALNNLGNLHERLGRFHEAMDHYTRALALADELGTRQGKAILRNNLGVVHTRLGNYAQAVRECRRALTAFRALGDLGGAARSLGNLGEIRGLAGRPADAIVRYEQALALVDEIGARGIAIELLNHRGSAHLALGTIDRARADHEAALEVARTIGDRYEEARALEGIGHALLAAGRADLAAGRWQRSAA
ncbi:ATP-binding protein, partial [Actinophytocola sp.]|uniref:ATP-binding protein n=1 Tax=Actinophytocola sp. TaxID=1872138 RepID=UPI003D6AD97A